LFILFASPPEQSLEWSDSGVEGAHRFLKRLWSYGQDYTYIQEQNAILNEGDAQAIDWQEAQEIQREYRRELHTHLGQILFDYQRNQFNTVVSGCMKILNLLYKLPTSSKDPYEIHLARNGFGYLLCFLAPITPHICHHLWRELGYGESILKASWPKVSKDALKIDVVEFVVQVNGKLRSHIKVSVDADEATIESAAKSDEATKRFINNKSIKKTIVITQRKLVNLVVAD